MTTIREQELLQRLESIVAGIARDTREAERADADRDAERAEAARAGALGPDWQAVQRRIDAGRTTLLDVFGGEDGSAAAVRLRAQSRERLELVAGTTDPPPGLVEQLATAREQMTRLGRPR